MQYKPWKQSGAFVLLCLVYGDVMTSMWMSVFQTAVPLKLLLKLNY